MHVYSPESQALHVSVTPVQGTLVPPPVKDVAGPQPPVVEQPPDTLVHVSHPVCAVHSVQASCVEIVHALQLSGVHHVDVSGSHGSLSALTVPSSRRNSGVVAKDLTRRSSRLIRSFCSSIVSPS